MEEKEDNVLFVNDACDTTETVQPPSHGKLVKTVALSAAFLGLGLAIAIPGPTLPYLQEQTGVGTDMIGYIFTVRSIGYLLGSMGSGWLFDRFGRHDLMFCLGLFFNAIGLVLSPWAQRLELLCVLLAFTGIAMGFLDTGGNVVCLQLWGKRSPPYIQALHFSFGIGAFVAPLMAAPFLEAELDAALISNTTGVASGANTASLFSGPVTQVSTSGFAENSTTGYTTEWLISNESTPADAPTIHRREMFDDRINNVQFVYLLMACFLLAVAIVFAAFEIRSCVTGATQRKVAKDENDNKHKRTDLPFLIKMLTLMFLFYVFYAGLEVAYGQFLATFAMRQSNFVEKQASLLTAVFWGVFTGGRCLAIFVARLCSSTTMILGSFVCSLIALIALCFAMNAHKAVVWTFSGLLGFGLAAIFPTGFTWADQHLDVGGKVAAVFVVGASVGEMALPATVGYLIENAGPMYMMYAILGFGLFDAAVFLLMNLLASPSCSGRSKYSVKEAEDIAMTHLAAPNSDVAGVTDE